MYKYGDKCVIRLSDGLVIPFDPDNKEFQRYLFWLSEGNIPEPEDTPIEN